MFDKIYDRTRKTCCSRCKLAFIAEDGKVLCSLSGESHEDGDNCSMPKEDKFGIDDEKM